MSTARARRLTLATGAVILFALGVLTLPAAFLSSDEMYGYTQSHAVLTSESKAYRIPYAEDVGSAFLPMGAGANADLVEGGVSPVYVWLTSPLAALGVAGAAATSLLFTVLLVGSCYVLTRDVAGARAGAFAALFVASAVPILFWGTFFMANIPTAAFFLAAMASLARLATTGRMRWAYLGLVMGVLAVSMRRDSLPLLLPLFVVLCTLAWHRSSLWFVAAAMVYFAVAGFRLSLGLSKSIQEALVMSGGEFVTAIVAASDRFLSYHPDDGGIELLRANTQEYVLALTPVLASIAILGILFIRRKARSRAWPIFAWTVATGLAYLIVAMTISTAIVADPPGVFSSLVRYALIGTIGLALLAAVSLERAATASRRPLVAVLLVALVVVPSTAQAALDEPGLGWAIARRHERVLYDDAVGRLPANAFLIGDEASKYVTARPVLTPNSALSPPSTYLLPLVDRLADRHGLRAYIHPDSFQADWNGPLGDYLTDTHHAGLASVETPFLEVIWTTTRLESVGVLGAGEWALDENDALHTAAPFATFRPPPTLATDLVHAPSPGILFRVIVRDSDTAIHSMGYLNAPQTANDLRVLREWQGTASGAWRTEELFIPADTEINGPFFVTGGLSFKEVRVIAMPGVVEL